MWNDRLYFNEKQTHGLDEKQMNKTTNEDVLTWNRFYENERRRNHRNNSVEPQEYNAFPYKTIIN